MDIATPFAPAERFAQIIQGLRQLLFTRALPTKLAGTLMMLFLNRLGRLATRFSAIVARARAGTLPAVVVAARTRRVVERTEPVTPPAAPAVVMPRKFGCLLEMVAYGWWVGRYTAEMQMLLEDKELLALYATAPQLGRVMRPLCRMLAVKEPLWLKLPKRVRRKRPPAEPFDAHPEMWRWPHISMTARFGTKKQRKQDKEWEAFFAERKKREEGG